METQPLREDTLVGLPFMVVAEDGNEYTLDLLKPTLSTIDELWDHFSKAKVLFDDNRKVTKESFMVMLLDRYTIVLSVNDVGVVYATSIDIGHDANVHYLFWDRVTRGRHRVILTAMKWLMEEFELPRVSVDVPIYAFSALHRIYKMGLRIEGRVRKGRKFDGKWSDTLHFGVLREEVTDEVLHQGFIEQIEGGEKWYGVLDNEEKLMRKILERRSE